MKLVYFSRTEEEKEYVPAQLPGIEVDVRMGKAQDDMTGDPEAEILSVFVESHLGAEEFARYPKLRLIATRSTGFDHIDLEAANARGIVVANVPAYGVNTVAEFAFALLLALSRHTSEAHARIAQTGSFSQEGMQGFDLMGKTIGIIGGGKIGLHMAKIARGFGMEVRVFDTRPDEAVAAEIGFTYHSFNDILAQSDILSLHVPYNEHTHHLINAENIGLIKRGAYLINTARGGVVDTVALVSALEQGILAGAGLDVLEEEGDMGDESTLFNNPHPRQEELRAVLANHYLMKHPRVIITPHIAFDTKEATQRILDTTIENIRAFAAGTPLNILP